MPEAQDRVVVVGAGMGGLACALSLACRGVPVTVLESAASPGGKMRPVSVGGQWVDSGPTVFTMRWVFEQLFEQAGASFAERVPCTSLSVLARHAWRGGSSTLDLLADQAAAREEVARFSGVAESRRFAAFCSEAAQLYRHLEGPYIRSERPTLGSMVRDLGPGGLAALIGLGPFASLWRTLGRRFSDPRLRQLFGRYATYCGSSPWHAPATLMLIAQVELDGVWSVHGGMTRLAHAIEDLAKEKAVDFRYGAAVREVLTSGDRACGVRLATGEVILARAVVFNGDTNALARGGAVSGAPAAVASTAPSSRSLSAMTWSMASRTEGFDLVRHNVFFDHDYRSEFDDIFGRGRLPLKPTVYVCAQDRLSGLTQLPLGPESSRRAGVQSVSNPEPATVASLSPPSVETSIGPQGERLLVLVNAPANGDRGTEDDEGIAREILSCETSTFELMEACGLKIDRTSGQEVRTTPWAFARRFDGTGGSLYGMATHGWMSSFNRASARTNLPGLFLAGGSVHPGPGVPMATMSGRLAAETVMAHLDSTSRSRRVVIAGGISTRSAMTGSMA